MFVTKNGVNYNDFVLVSSVLLARCKGMFVKLDSGLHGHRPVCFNVVHRKAIAKVQGVGWRCDNSICQEALVQSAACRLRTRL